MFLRFSRLSKNIDHTLHLCRFLYADFVTITISSICVISLALVYQNVQNAYAVNHISLYIYIYVYIYIYILIYTICMLHHGNIHFCHSHTLHILLSIDSFNVLFISAYLFSHLFPTQAKLQRSWRFG